MTLLSSIYHYQATHVSLQAQWFLGWWICHHI